MNEEDCYRFIDFNIDNLNVDENIIIVNGENDNLICMIVIIFSFYF